MSDVSEGPGPTKLAEGIRVSAVSAVVEAALVVTGSVVVLGAASSAGAYLLSLVVAVPVTLYAVRRWIEAS